MYYIYFIRERRGGSNLIKIGKTGDCPYLRLDQLRQAKRKIDRYNRYELLGVIGIPFERLDANRIDKRTIQNQFEDLRETGDWFRPGELLLKYIGKNARPHFCDRFCPEGPSIEEEMRGRDLQAGEPVGKSHESTYFSSDEV